MSFLPHVDYLHAVAGLMVGILVGLTGVGGGSLMTPLLVLMFGINPQTAVGTDLLYAATTKTVGSAVHGWRETVDWRIMRRLACGSVPTAVVTLAVLAWVGPIAKHTQLAVLVILAVMLALTSLAVIFQKQLIAFAQTRRPMDSPHVIYSTAALGAVIGLAVSLSSVGAGAIGVTALLMMYPNLPIARIVGTDIAHAVPLALVAGLGHWMIGDVNLVLLFSLLCGSIPGVIIGSLLSSRAPDRWLRPALAVVLMLSSWQLFAKSVIGDKPAKHDKPAAAAAR
jgi:uncharacterized membrane protein YfcA